MRLNPVVSRVLFALFCPVRRFAVFASEQIPKKIQRNGGIATFDGIRLIFPRHVGAGFLSAISWHGVNGFEPHTWRTLRFLLKDAGTFIDVGSNIGFYSVLAASTTPGIAVIAFEPQPELYRKCLQFLSANSGISAVLHPVALGDADGHAVLYQPTNIDESEISSASTIASVSWQARKQHSEILVRTAKLDTVLSGCELKLPLVLKIDVEDHEAAVLRGAEKTIAKYRPLVVCEILPRILRDESDHRDERPKAEQHQNAATVEVLKSLDYVAFGITASGYFRFGAMDFGLMRSFTDFLLVPRERAPFHRVYAHSVDQVLDAGC